MLSSLPDQIQFLVTLFQYCNPIDTTLSPKLYICDYCLKPGDNVG